MRFVIVTGLSGSGKTTALKMLEDNGYFCVDNLPPELIGKFAELASNPAQEYSRVALGLDVRSLYRAGDSGKLPERRQTALKIAALLKELDAYPHEILFPFPRFRGSGSGSPLQGVPPQAPSRPERPH